MTGVRFEDSGGELGGRDDQSTGSRPVPGDAEPRPGSGTERDYRTAVESGPSAPTREQPAAGPSSRVSVIDEQPSRPAPPDGASEEEYKWHSYKVYPSGRPDAVASSVPRSLAATACSYFFCAL